MFKALGLRKAHALFLESCRNLADGRDYWSGAGPLKKWFLQTIVPVPLLSLHEDGQRLHEALKHLEAQCRACPLTEEAILDYHRRVSGKKEKGAGVYRTGPITVVGSSITRSPGPKVPALMKQLDLKLREEQERLDATKTVDEAAVLSLAVDTYQRLGLIHPFRDANGRVARLAMNHLLRRYAMGYVILPPLSEKSPLWEALQKAHAGNSVDLEAFARECISLI